MEGLKAEVQTLMADNSQLMDRLLVAPRSVPDCVQSQCRVNNLEMLNKRQ